MIHDCLKLKHTFVGFEFKSIVDNSFINIQQKWLNLQLSIFEKIKFNRSSTYSVGCCVSV